MSLRKQFFILGFGKDFVGSATMTLVCGCWTVGLAIEGEWTKFLFPALLTAVFGLIAIWSGKNLLEEVEEQEAQRRKWPNNF
jgi:hypothetical protein